MRPVIDVRQSADQASEQYSEWYLTADGDLLDAVKDAAPDEQVVAEVRAYMTAPGLTVDEWRTQITRQALARLSGAQH